MRLKTPGRRSPRPGPPMAGRVALLAAGLLVCAAAPTPRTAPVWTVDKAASRISFRTAPTGRAFDGVFKRWEARLAFDPADLRAARLSVVVEAASAVTGEPARDAVLPGPAWLAAARFPRAGFTSRSFAAAGPGRYLVAGDLTVRGVTRPLAVPLAVQPTRGGMELTGGVALDRSVFGIGPAGGDGVVQVSVRLAARRSR